MRAAGWTGPLLTAVLVLSGCTAVDDTTSEEATPPSAPTSSETQRREARGSASPKEASRAPAQTTDRPVPPTVGACYDLGFRAATEPTDDSDPVECTEPHTAQTYFVGRLDTVVDGHLLAVDSRRAQRQVARTCPRQLKRYVGGSAEARALSRLQSVWFSPTLAESDRGASWFRCDVVALARPGRLASLPPPPKVRRALDEPQGLDRFGLCGTAPPGAPKFERVICARPHAWRALSTIRIPGGEAYPGVERVREAGESTCRNRVRQVSDSPDRFTYGWEWPTREQWQAGQHFGYCWAPD